MSIDDELERLLAQQAAAAEQLQSEVATVAGTLASLRTQLLVHGFTTDGAEEICTEWFIRLLESPPAD